MIMPSSSSSSKPTSDTPPILTFTGPDRDNTLYISHPNGSKTPIFTVETHEYSKPNVKFSKIFPDGSKQDTCTATFSSLSGSITLSFNGQELKLKEGLDGLVFSGPSGELKWKSSGGSSSIYDLVDQAKVKIARYTFKGKGEPRLEIFVPCEDGFVDLVICSGVAVGVKKKKTGEEVAAGFEIVGHLLGA